MELQGKIAIVTGAASGMGAAVGRLFVEHGAQVVGVDREWIESPDIVGYQHDVADEVAWKRLVDEVVSRFGHIDVLANCAGIVCFGDFLQQSMADFEQVVRVNLLGTCIGMKVAGARMVKQGAGSIINISSTDGMRATNGGSAYAASKWAVRGLAKAAALELGHRGVRVNTILPGLVDTPLVNPQGIDMSNSDVVRAIPLQRMGRAEEIARACLFFASDASSYCNGSELVVDGGTMSGKYVSFLPGAPK